MSFTSQGSAACSLRGCQDFRSAATYRRHAPAVRNQVEPQKACPRQLMQSDLACIEAEERRQLRCDNAGHQSLAATAIERAQVRHRLRLQRLSCTEPEQLLEEEVVTDSMHQQVAGPVAAIRVLKEQCQRQPPLNRAEEMRLTHAMAQGKHWGLSVEALEQPQQAALYNTSRPASGLDMDQVQHALQQMHAAEVARRKLTQANLGLVLKVVLAYSQQRQVDMQDLILAGMYGLSRGLDKFDPGRGNRVSTVAYMWIKEAVGRAYNESAHTIKLSERTLTNMRKIAAAQEQQQLASNSVPTSPERLQQLTGLSQTTFATAMRASKLREKSLEAASESSSSSGKVQHNSLIDQISSTDCNDESLGATDSSISAAESLIEVALQQLPNAEAKVLHHVYGLQDGCPKSRPQVAKVMGLGLHHIRKLEARAFALLRGSHLGAISVS